jgi:phenylpropionate dioxygenase-like ring-hydroxylating dioxygenase large terminal subunit
MNTKILPQAYVDPTVYAVEQKKIFRRLWMCMGLRRDVAKHNDFISREIGGMSVVVHNFDGMLKAFHNVCTHRFNRIHSTPKGNRPLQCAYHGWTFNAEGIPTAIPKRPRFDDLTPERICDLRLAAWRVETCGELVFVCGDAQAPNLRTYLGTAFEDIERMTNACGAVIDENVMTIRANWKILVENTLESYHVGFIHPGTFARLGAAEGQFGWQGEHSTWDTALGPKFAARIERLMPLFSSRPVKLPGYHHQLIFPNVTLASTHGTSFSLQFFEPVTPSETRFTSVVFQTKLDQASDAAHEALGALNQSVKEFNRAVFSEDKEVCEQVQLGTAETGKTGILSDEELRVGKFQENYSRLMETTS